MEPFFVTTPLEIGYIIDKYSAKLANPFIMPSSVEEWEFFLWWEGIPWIVPWGAILVFWMSSRKSEQLIVLGLECFTHIFSARLSREYGRRQEDSYFLIEIPISPSFNQRSICSSMMAWTQWVWVLMLRSQLAQQWVKNTSTLLKRRVLIDVSCREIIALVCKSLNSPKVIMIDQCDFFVSSS